VALRLESTGYAVFDGVGEDRSGELVKVPPNDEHHMIVGVPT